MMSWLQRVLGKRAGTPLAADAPPGPRIHIVDATGLLDPRQRTGNGQPSPRDHFGVLRSLAQFAGREGLEFTAVFTGRPLREAGDGAVYKGVRVMYAEQPAEVREIILRLVRRERGRRAVILVTLDPALEREAARLGAACLRSTTLKKYLDDREDRGGETNEPARDRSDRSDRGGRGRGPRDRNPRPRQPQPAPPTTPAQRPEPARETPPATPEPVREPSPPPAAAPTRPDPAPESPRELPAPSDNAPPDRSPAPAREPPSSAPPREKFSPGVLDLIDPV